jgi:hypothetical protein
MVHPVFMKYLRTPGDALEWTASVRQTPEPALLTHMRPNASHQGARQRQCETWVSCVEERAV